MVPDALTQRIRAEFLEMPGLRLTLAQAQRLCGVEQSLCEAVFDALVDAQFLCRTSNGTYARVTDGALAPPRTVRADLRPVRRFEEAS